MEEVFFAQGKKIVRECKKCREKRLKILNLRLQLGKIHQKVENESSYKLCHFSRYISELKSSNEEREKSIQKLTREETKLRLDLLNLSRKLNRIRENNKRYYNNPNSNISLRVRQGEDSFIEEYNKSFGFVFSGEEKPIREKLYVDVDSERNTPIMNLKEKLMSNTFLKKYQVTNDIGEATYFLYFVNMNRERKMFFLKSDLFYHKCRKFIETEKRYFCLNFRSSFTSLSKKRIILLVARNEKNLNIVRGNTSKVLVMNRKVLRHPNDKILFFSVPDGKFRISENILAIRYLKKIMNHSVFEEKKSIRIREKKLQIERERLRRIWKIGEKDSNNNKRNNKKKKEKQLTRQKISFSLPVISQPLILTEFQKQKEKNIPISI